MEKLNIYIKEPNLYDKNFWNKLTLFITLLYFVLTVYYAFFSFQNNYIGVRVARKDSEWVVKRVYEGGLAEKANIYEGDKIILIDSSLARNNIIMTNWLVLEQIETITLTRGNEKVVINFPKVNFIELSFIYLFEMSFCLLLFLIIFYRKQLLSNTSKVFFICITIAVFIALSMVPSSMGNSNARIVMIFGLSILPLIFQIYLNQMKRDKQGKVILFFCIAFFTFNSFSAFLTTLIKLPYLLAEYLSLYFIFILMIIIILQFLVHRFIYEKNKNKFQINIPLILIISMIPLLFLYIFPIDQSAPFSVLILFFILPFFSIFHFLAISRVLKFRYKLNRQGLFMLLTCIISFIIFASIEILKYATVSFAKIYIVILVYAFLPIIQDLFMIVNKKNKSIHSLELFLAIENEREKISTHIHDSVIQDLIHLGRGIESESITSKKEIRHLLEESIYDLRELCSDIYPLLIKEIGLVKTLDTVIRKLEQRFPISINYAFNNELTSESSELNIFILRSLKELMNNSILHGKATELTVTNFVEGNFVIFELMDNGVLEDVETNHLHFGLNTIKEKLNLLLGDLEILSEPTTVRLKIPKDNFVEEKA